MESHASENIFLAPGKGSHLRSISRGIDLDKIENVLTEEEKGSLKQLGQMVRLWGTTSERSNILRTMKKDAHVLFVPSGTGTDQFYGQAFLTIHNAPLARRMEELGIWPEDGRNYEHIFFIKDFREISIPKKDVNKIDN